MIQLKPITEENFELIIKMKLPDKERILPPNIYSLAQAWLYNDIARPYGIYQGQDLVGFLMLGLYDESKIVNIWRIMIVPEKQGQGLGQETIKTVIDKIKEEHNNSYQYLKICYVPSNGAIEHICHKLGFSPTGEMDNGEIVLLLDLQKK